MKSDSSTTVGDSSETADVHSQKPIGQYRQMFWGRRGDDITPSLGPRRRLHDTDPACIPKDMGSSE
ncbi:MAG: hypothetical protein PHI31_16335 [Desulfuromonadaceae bacterium]|nr:hypothetical protein [Desulfuromonadaceae bacterium]